jgi:hypothetical protein
MQFAVTLGRPGEVEVGRSRVSESLPEKILQGLRWKEVQTWLRRIPNPRVRAAVERALRLIRE